jgi:hypothetical protein
MSETLQSRIEFRDAAGELVATFSPTREFTDAQLDGRACLHCGGVNGPMIPLGYGPHGQVFAHQGCRS